MAADHRMKPLQLRPLGAAERALAAEVFGAGLDCGPMRVLALPVWRRAFVAGPCLMVWPAASARADFSLAPLSAQAMFVHELAHLWQAQNGVGLLRAKLRAGDGAAAYAYDRAGVQDFAALNIEQQAMVIEHAFLASHGAKTPLPAHIYAEAQAGWRRA
jgi:hypothetical protein